MDPCLPCLATHSQKIMNRQVFRTLVIAAVLPLSLFLRRDMARFIALDDYVLSFLVQAGSCFIILAITIVSIWGYGRNREWSRSVKIGHSTFLLTIFGLSLVFSQQISNLREIVEFKLHEQAYLQLINIAQPIRNTPSYTLNCFDYLKLPDALANELGHRQMFIYDYQNEHWIGLVQDRYERESSIFYIDGLLPRLGDTIQHCQAPIQCYFQVSTHWFLCTVFKPDVF